jgi:inorganic phosphate transporter, PiT family
LHEVSFGLVGLVLVALAFEFLNGLHDAANSIATIVSTRVLRPQYAVFWAAFFNFIAFMLFGLHVATTVGSGIVSPQIVDDYVVFGALMGAISWNLLTRLLGIPSSSSHALIGAIVGVGAARRVSAVRWSIARDIVVAWVVTMPMAALIAALFYALARCFA